MKERAITAIILIIIIIASVNLNIFLAPALMAFCFIIWEILARKPLNIWSMIGMAQAAGMAMLPFFAPREIFFIALAVGVNDTMAYFGGKYFNFGILRKNIFPKTSPKKTWGGFFYGLISACLGASMFNYFWPVGAALPVGFLGAVMSLFAVGGDWLESKFKRSHGIKDSGEGMITEKILKGHGGFFDRFDAISLAAWGWLLISS